MGGINASLQLLNYKIDGISFEHSSNVNFILNNQFDPKKIKTSVSLRVPQKLKDTDNYICCVLRNIGSHNSYSGII